MPTERDLFEAILQNPDDIPLRLIYADWCDERGDARGEFIRVQCELDSHPGPPIASRSLRQREAELLEDNRRDWNGEIHRRLAQTPLRNRVHSRRGAIRRWEYRRGFVEFLVLEANTLLQYADLLFAIGPINTVRIVQAANLIDQILKSPVLRRMKTMEIVLPHLRWDQAEAQIAIRRPRDLSHVEIRPVHCQPTVEGFGAAIIHQPVGLFARLVSLIRSN